MLAIIIPYYKIDYFEQNLQSLSNQTCNRFKVYIGDDNSKQNPNHILNNYINKFDFKYQKFDNNLGSSSLVSQWNRCVEMINDEEWIMILGDDDVLGNNVVEQFYLNLGKINSNVVRFASIKIDDKSNEFSETYFHPKTETSINFLFRNTRSSLSEYVFKAKILNKIGFKDFPLAWFSDILAVLEMSNFDTVYTINEAKVYVRVSNLSISGKTDNIKLKSKATYLFYNYLLTKKSIHFSINQRKELLEKINFCYKYDKKNLLLLLKISRIYWNNFFIKEYFKFLNSVIKSIYKSR